MIDACIVKTRPVGTGNCSLSVVKNYGQSQRLSVQESLIIGLIICNILFLIAT
ncbi:MAG: hypothetical protein ABIB46_05550 [bacterium]